MRLPALLLLPFLAACMTAQEAPPPAYSQASPYAPGAYAAAEGATVVAPAPDSYCEEAVAEAQDAAAIAAASASPRDQGRARRTAEFAARDCR